MEKFFNIKCRTSQKRPNAVVLVCTVRALKMHGGGPPVTAGAPLKKEYTEENIDLLEKGLPNLIKHISNGLKYGVPVVVAINVHGADSPAEHEIVRKAALANGAYDAVICTHWSDGGAGATDLADAVINACNTSNDQFKFLYELNSTIEDKIMKISKEMYGAGSVEFTPQAKSMIKLYSKLGYDNLTISMAKTSNSLTGDPAIKGAPSNFTLVINDVLLSAGAGFIVPMCGEISKMPGLPTRPCLYDIDLNTETGEIQGLF